jgi:hypothetical protein
LKKNRRRENQWRARQVKRLRDKSRMLSVGAGKSCVDQACLTPTQVERIEFEGSARSSRHSLLASSHAIL